jgi:hypothetical protein
MATWPTKKPGYSRPPCKYCASPPDWECLSSCYSYRLKSTGSGDDKPSTTYPRRPGKVNKKKDPNAPPKHKCDTPCPTCPVLAKALADKTKELDKVVAPKPLDPDDAPIRPKPNPKPLDPDDAPIRPKPTPTVAKPPTPTPTTPTTTLPTPPTKPLELVVELVKKPRKPYTRKPKPTTTTTTTPTHASTPIDYFDEEVILHKQTPTTTPNQDLDLLD